MIKLPDTDGLQDRVRLAEQTGPGPRLRAAREAGCYDIEDIAKQLRLHPQIIRDLEKDKFPDHLALVFVRGYLRAYANLIGLNADQVVEEFNALGYQEERSLPDFKGKPQSRTRMRTEQEMRSPSLSPRVKWAAISLIAAALGGVFVAYNYEPKEELYPVNVPPAEVTADMQNTPTIEGETTDTLTTDSTLPAAQVTTPAPTPVRATPPTRPVPAPSADESDSNRTEPQLPRPGFSNDDDN